MALRVCRLHPMKQSRQEAKAAVIARLRDKRKTAGLCIQCGEPAAERYIAPGRWPYPMFPDRVTEVGAAEWDALGWNPPQQKFTMPRPDPAASLKPSWARIQLHHRRIDFAVRRGSLLKDLRNQARRLIEADTLDSDGSQAATIRERYGVARARIEAASTVDELAAIAGGITSGEWAAEPEG